MTTRPSVEEYAQVLRRDLMAFIERAFYELNPETAFCPAPYLEMIANALEACREGRIRRLIINLPPRHLKSHCVSVAFVAWYLAHHPARHVICASYGQDLADKLARDCRNLLRSDWFRSAFATRLTQQAVNDFSTTAGGTRLATSVGGVLTGRGADLIVVDDASKPDEALSDTRRKAVNEWYDHSLISRLNDKEKGCIILVMQRLHQDDLVGHVLENGEDWTVLSFPAIAESDERHEIVTSFGSRRRRRIWERKTGAALHPERESLATLRAIRDTMGDYAFLSQYQQTPTPVGGALIKTAWLRYYEPSELPAHFATILQSWDTANKAAELNDYSVCTTWGVAGDTYYLLDVLRRRLNYPDLKRAVSAQAKQFPMPTILIEDKASGTQLIQELKGEGLPWVKAYEPPSGTDKVMRLHAQSIAFENGHVRLPRTAPWLADYVTELTGFPGARHDDQVDSTTQALDYLRSGGSVLALWEKLGR